MKKWLITIYVFLIKCNMKIALINNFYVRNYGSVLQSFAMYKVLCNMGVETEVIDFKDIPSIENRIKGLLLLNTELIFKKFIGLVKKERPSSQYYEDCKKRNFSFDEFSQRNFRFTRHYKTISELSRDICDFDIVLIGSDQLWGPNDILRNYHTLLWVPKTVKKVSYATSFGVGSLPFIVKNKARRFLRKMDFLSVREASGKEIIKELINKEVPVVMDPTLLLEQSEWKKITGSKRLVEGNYIFAFFLGKNESHRQYVKQISKQKNLKIVSIQHVEEYIELDNGFADITFNNANPLEFINLIKFAEYVFTDSFHVSIFSIINERNFFVLNRYNDTSSNSRNTRLVSLLNQLGIPERLISNDELVNIDIDSRIDYLAVNENIERWRKLSADYLIKAIKI